MTPTIFRQKGYRFFFFSREEDRIHVHIYSADGEAKYWIEPNIELANSHGLTQKQLNDIQKIVEERKNEIKRAWNRHFGN